MKELVDTVVLLNHARGGQVLLGHLFLHRAAVKGCDLTKLILMPTLGSALTVEILRRYNFPCEDSDTLHDRGHALGGVFSPRRPRALAGD
jgi:hypothetical protein